MLVYFISWLGQGGFKSALSFTEAEGDPILLSLCGCFLAVATDKGAIKLYDVSKRAKIDASTLPVKGIIWKMFQHIVTRCYVPSSDLITLAVTS